MELFARIAVATASLLSIAIADPASAQSLRDKLIGAWNLDVGSEISQDGKKVVPWSAGSLILDPSGRILFCYRKRSPERQRRPAKPGWSSSYVGGLFHFRNWHIASFR
jgi:hypothetical protein